MRTPSSRLKTFATADMPGRNVAAKAGLNRGILDAAWGEFARQLSYKVGWRGHSGQPGVRQPHVPHVRARVGRKPEDAKRLRLRACGHTENADVHAAKNILAAGHAVWLA